MRRAAFFFAVLFLLAALLQWNDPDPAIWMAGYGLAAALSALAAIGRYPACLLGDEGHGVCLIKQPQLACGMVRRGRIQKDPTLQQGAVKICDERTNVTLRVRTTGFPVA